VCIPRKAAAAAGWATYFPAGQRQEKDRKVLETVAFLIKMTGTAAESATQAAWTTSIESSFP
jgi:hypothetical protein